MNRWKIEFTSQLLSCYPRNTNIQCTTIFFTYNNNQRSMIMLKNIFRWFVELNEIRIAWFNLKTFSLLLLPPTIVSHQEILNSRHRRLNRIVMDCFVEMCSISRLRDVPNIHTQTGRLYTTINSIPRVWTD
jgi:hypothetical protein